MGKSKTDLHWNERAAREKDDAKVNIADTVQRDLELDFVFAHLPRAGRVVEVGCGNGYVSRQVRERVAQLDSFDYAENMVERARRSYGEQNNRFFHGSVLDPSACAGETYDAAICVRVLINLRDLAEQAAAIGNIAGWLKPGGTLILVEGFRDGFDALNRLRHDIALPDILPAAINCYVGLTELMPKIEERFEIVDTFHTGMFDFLTRIIYPRLVGPDRVGEDGEFHRKIEIVARQFNPAALSSLARVRGFALAKRQGSPR